MVRQRRYGKRRVYKRRKRYTPKGRYNRTGRVRRKIGTGTHRLVRTFQANDLNAAGATAYVFSLQNLPNYTEFTGLFDQYCITGIQFHFVPNQVDAETGSATAGLTQMWICNDLDAGGPTSTAEMLERPNAKLLTFNRPRKWYLRGPRVADEVYRSVSTTAYGPGKRNKWLDCAYVDVPHYGTNVVITDIAANTTITVYCKVYMRFRGMR